MLTPTELRAFECIFTGRKRETDPPLNVGCSLQNSIERVKLYLKIRRYLLGGEVDRIVKSKGRYELHVVGKGLIASTGFVWEYSGARPGKPVINFSFTSIGQNSADVCFHQGFTLNLLFAKRNTNMNCRVPKGWTEWSEQRRVAPTRKWAAYHNISDDFEQHPEIVAGITAWHRHWDMA